MSDPRWDRTWEIFHAVLELPAGEQAAHLNQLCKQDAELRAEVESLLDSHSRPGDLPSPEEILGDLPGDDELAVAAAGQWIGPYRIVREIGQGGMGVVYEAEQEEPVRRRVALKLIRLGMDTQQVVARFEAERQALALMSHPNIARVLDAGATDSGRPYFVMEYVEGEPITRYCDAQRMSTSDRLRLFLEVCAGVQHAHQKGVIHRDLKPTNVLVAEEDGRPVPKIIDFGIAKATGQSLTAKTLLTQAGLLIGTPEYMSPEQADLSDLDVDTRTDVYSLGVLLYELLAGTLPFEPEELRRAGFDEIRRRIREEDPPRPSSRVGSLAESAGEAARNRRSDTPTWIRRLRGDLDWITMRALEKTPDRRYPSPSELAADLRRHLRDEPVQAGPPATSYRMGKFVRRHRVAVAAGTVAALALLLGSVGATFGLVRARVAERQALEQARTATEVSEFLVGLFDISRPSAADVDAITAREVLDRGVERIRDELEGQPAIQSRLMFEMGSVYAQLGHNTEAESLMLDALRIRRELPATTDAEIATLLENLGSVRHQMGRNQEAIELLEESIRLWERIEGSNGLRLARTLRNLGGIHESTGNYEESLRVLERARSIFENALRPDDPELGRILQNLGIVHWGRGDFESSRTMYEQALEILEAAQGPDHPDVSYVVNSLAILNWNLEDFATARPMFERTLANLERTLGPEHPNTASARNNLGRLLLDMELLDEARPHIELALAQRLAALGPDHPDVATSLLNLGLLQVADGELEGARESLRRCLEIRESSLGPRHRYVAATLDAYAGVLRQLGEEEQAGELEDRAREIRDKEPGRT